MMNPAAEVTDIGAATQGNNVPLGNSDPPSLANPSWNYLQETYTKLELQNHCREIGLTKVWVTKEKLIDMIMNKHRSLPLDDVVHQEPEPETSIERIISEVEKMKERLNRKDTEIAELNELLKTSQITINKLSDRLSTLEERIRYNEGHLPDVGGLPPSSTPIHPEKSLLLGDSNISHVLSTDLGAKCSIRTIKGANTDLLTCWVSEKLNWTPARCILYCGFHDILENITAATILDRLGTLVAELKQRNENMEIFVCQLVSTVKEDLRDKIDHYNIQLTEWCSTNGVSLIKTDQSFTLGTGEVDEMCFGVPGDDSDLLLNRLGAIRLLSAIDRQCLHFNLCEDWNMVKRNCNFSSKDRISHNDDKKFIGFSSRINHQRSNRPRQNSYYRNTYENDDYTSDGVWPSDEYRSIPNSRQNSRPYVRPSFYDERPRYVRQGCDNCGERNHQQSNCRHDYRIKCNSCHQYGHKSRFCPNYSA